MSTIHPRRPIAPSHRPLRAALAGALTLLAASFGGCAAAPPAAPKEFMFWPAAPDAPAVQYLTTISFTSDVTGQQEKFEELVYGKTSQQDLPLQRPFGIRMYDGKIYTCDATSACVMIFDLRKKEVRVLGKGGNAGLVKPIDIAVGPDGVKYVADTGLGAIVAFDSEDKFAGRISIPNMRPVALAVHGEELFVSDMRASQVRVLHRVSGKQLRTIGKPGMALGELGGAMGVTVDRQGNVYANDVTNAKVQVFTNDGKPIRQMGGMGNRPGYLARPKMMAVGPDGFLYVVDNAFQNVQVFDTDGKLRMFFGGSGNFPGSMNLPTGICITTSDLDLFQKHVHPAFDLKALILVSNNWGPEKLNIYGLGTLKPGKTVADISAGRAGGSGIGFGSAIGEGEPDTQPKGPSLPTTLPGDLKEK